MKNKLLKTINLTFYYSVDILYSVFVIFVNLFKLKKIGKQKLTIVTAASSTHAKSLMQFLNSVSKYSPNSIVEVFSLDLNPTQLEELNSFTINNRNIITNIFKFNEYPEHFNIVNHNGSYAWKGAIIHEVYNRSEGLVLWLDAGNLINNNLFFIKVLIYLHGFFSPLSSNRIVDWTHPDTLKKFENLEKYYQKRNKNGAIIGFDTNNEDSKLFIEDFYKMSIDKSYISPDGSSRENHRYDQSIISLLFFKHFNKFIPKTYKLFGISIHNDID